MTRALTARVQGAFEPRLCHPSWLSDTMIGVCRWPTPTHALTTCRKTPRRLYVGVSVACGQVCAGYISDLTLYSVKLGKLPPDTCTQARRHAGTQARTRIPMHTCPHRCRHTCDFQTLTASRYADESGAVKQAARGAAIAEPGRGGRGRQGRQNFESAGSRHGAQGRAGGGKGRRTYAAPRRAGGKRHRGQEHQATGGASSAADERSGHGPRSQRGARGGDASADLQGQGAGRAAR